jgi:hypothetical protein
MHKCVTPVARKGRGRNNARRACGLHRRHSETAVGDTTPAYAVTGGTSLRTISKPDG